MKRRRYLAVGLAGLAGFTASAQGPELAARHIAVFTAPPRAVPTRAMPDGPLLGNGDVGVVLAGPPEQLRFFISKNDFWARDGRDGLPLTDDEARAGRTTCPHTLNAGRVLLDIPALAGGSYRLEQRLDEAKVRGSFTKGELTVQSTSRVDANANFLITEFACAGGEAELVIRQLVGASAAASAAIGGGATAKLNVGREQHGGGRWYFKGELAGLAISGKPVSAEDLHQAAATPPAAGEKFDGQTTWRELAAPPLDQAVTVSAWIKLDDSVTDQWVGYVVSNGEWDKAYSLGVTLNRRLRWSVNGQMVESPQSLERGKWIHVAGVADATGLAAYVNGEPAGHSASGSGGLDRTNAILWSSRAADPHPGSRQVAWATRLVGAVPETSGDVLRARLVPGKPVTIVTAIASELDTVRPVKEVTERLLALDPATLAGLSEGHAHWWQRFWSHSFIEIPDQEIERHWYAALYTLASCNREGKVPAGLWGWPTSDDPAWCGAYTLNYNYETPYYIALSSNHPELMRNFFQPVLDFVPRALRRGKEQGYQGIWFPTGIGPWGWHYEAPPGPWGGVDPDFGQRSNASYLSMNFIWYWQYTQDEAWLKAVGYPFVRGVAEFWENYLQFRDGRYVDENDAIHELASRSDVNPLLSLGLIRTLFRNLIPMSETLGVDADRRAKWQDILDKLSPYPIQERNGKTVFRYTEKGTAWWGDNTLGIQHIFPGGGIGLDSDAKLLEISHNTIEAMGRWVDGNGMASWYPACARVGYDPKVILEKLRDLCDHRSMPNGMLATGGGGIEALSIFNVLNEMLLQSHDASTGSGRGGVIRLFPCWPRDLDARFGTLRAVGAFVVSAELKSGVVAGVKIVSEKGRDCTVQNPWPGRKVQLRRGDRPAELLEGDRFQFATAVHETIILEPQY